MSLISPRVVGNTIIVGLFTTLVLLMGLLVVEYGSVARYLSNRVFGEKEHYGGSALIGTNYYGKRRSADPYELLIVQHLHPHYVFSLPWRERDRLNASNDVVSINKEGFRDSLAIEGKPVAVLLGGSAAFGHFVSSNRMTIAYRLSEETEYQFKNRNSPSWNSHQELIALAKYAQPMELSLSFSLANDIGVFCKQTKPSGVEYFVDQPESFTILAGYFNDLRGGLLPDQRPMIERVKFVSRRTLPETYRLLQLITISLGSDFETNRGGWEACVEEDARLIAESYIRNQTTMADLSEARGGFHLVALQPHYSFHNETRMGSRFRRLVYDFALNSEFCRDRCLDLSKITESAADDVLFDGENISTALFADEVHFTDQGVEAILARLIPYIEQQTFRRRIRQE